MSARQRTLVRVASRYHDADGRVARVTVVLPAWRDASVVLDLETLPPEVLARVSDCFPVRLHAHANLDAQSPDDIVLDQWELA